MSLSLDRKTHPDRTLIIIPAYNEQKNLPSVLVKIKNLYPNLDVLVVDDGSQDSTGKVAKTYKVRLVSHPLNLGYGAAVQTGYKYALDYGYSYVVQIDADGQHEVEDIPSLLEPVRQGICDLALGSRFLGGGNYTPSWARAWGIKFFGAIASRLLKQTITDPTSGFQAMNNQVMKLYTGKHYADDYPDADTLVMVHYSGLRIKEVPVRMYPKQGTSMHRGLWRPLYYMAKMCLSLLTTYSLKEHFNRRSSAARAAKSR
jgi:glycosyltransferase involved in cell wall biosynthesis